MILVRYRRNGIEQRYYSLAEAASMITKNQWDIPVEGIHSESLRRSYRDLNAKGTDVGKRIGRDVFFTVDDLMLMGYEVEEDSDRFVDMGNVIELNPEGDTSEQSGN